MRQYICKVLRPEFLEALNAFITGMHRHEVAYKKRLEIDKSRRILYNAWCNPTAPNSEVLFMGYPVEFREPLYDYRVFEAKEGGLQQRPRIMWNNAIVRIDDVEEIFQYERLKHNEPRNHNRLPSMP